MERAIRVRRLVDGRIYEREIRRGSWLTTDETTRLLGVSRRTLFNLIRRGGLTPRKVRGRLRFRFREVMQLRKGGEF
jgi:excisionase family DNA binding protein